MAIRGRSEGGVGERHQRSSKPALLGQCDPVVNEQGNPNKPKKMIPSPSPFRGRGKFVFLGGKPNSARCGPVCGFGGRLGKRHQQSPRPALLEACGAAVDESGTAANLDERKPAPSTQARGRAGRRKAEKEKKAQPGLQRQRFGAWDSPRWKKLSSTQRMGSERAEAACIAETLSSGDRV